MLLALKQGKFREFSMVEFPGKIHDKLSSTQFVMEQLLKRESITPIQNYLERTLLLCSQE